MQKDSQGSRKFGVRLTQIPFSMEVLRKKNIIRTWILPHLSTGSRRPACQADLLEVVETILYKLKTGCQWRPLPLKSFFTEVSLSGQSVSYSFNEWLKDGSWKKRWVTLLHVHKARLDRSSIQLDGRYTRTHTGGAVIGYQGCKAARTHAHAGNYELVAGRL